jgi:hypothetical protein
MTEKEFIEKLRSIPYSREEYARLGVSDAFIENTISGYNPKQRNRISMAVTDDPLIRLVSVYDVSKTEIGLIWLGDEVTETEDYYYVGKFEVDYLCISKFSHEVVIIPFDDPLSIMYKCSQNGFLFLDAIVEAAKFLETCGMEKNVRTNQGLICSMAVHCAELAGGKEYLTFYQVLLGCFS